MVKNNIISGNYSPHITAEVVIRDAECNKPTRNPINGMCSVQLADSHLCVTYDGPELDKPISYVMRYKGSLHKHLECELRTFGNLAKKLEDSQVYRKYVQSQRIISVLRTFT